MNHILKRSRQIGGALLFCAWIVPNLWADWIPVGGSLNESIYQDAKNPSMGVSNGTQYVAWREFSNTSNQVVVKWFNGTAWEKLGGSLNTTPADSAARPWLAFSNTTPYVAWQEYNSNSGTRKIYVKKYGSGTWQSVGGSINVQDMQQAESPSLALWEGTPYVTWNEQSGGIRKVYVKYWSGSSWVLLGDCLNVDAGRDALSPRMIFCNSTPYIAWYENSATGWQIYVKHWNGNAWQQDGGSLRVDPSQNADLPSMTVFQNTPYVAWCELKNGQRQIYVKYLVETQWVQAGGSLNNQTSASACAPSIAASQDMLSVAWYETTGSNNQIVVKDWDGQQWITNSNQINVQLDRDAEDPCLAVDQNAAYVTWSETSETGNQVYVKRTQNLIYSIMPEHAVSGQKIQVTIEGAFHGTVPVAKLTHGSVEVLGTSLQIEEHKRLVGQFDFQVYPGNYNLQIGKSNEVLQLTNRFSILKKLEQPICWYTSDLGFSGYSEPTDNRSKICIVDGNQDNAHELFVADQSPKLNMLKQNGGVWAATALPIHTDLYTSVVPMDENRDGKFEMYGATLDGHVYQFCWNGSAWDNQSLVLLTSPVNALASGDGDNDSKPELYVACNNGHVYQIKNSNSGWGLTDLGVGLLPMTDLVLADLDHDKKRELYGANKDKSIYQFKNANHVWSMLAVGASGSGIINALAAGDADADNSQELYAAQSDGSVCQYKLAGNVLTATAVTTGNGSWNGLAVNDADNDGNDEIYATHSDGHVYQLKNQSGWQKKDLGSAGTALKSIAIGDANDDSEYEVFAVGSNHHIYQFKAVSIAPTATPTPTASATPTATITSTPTPIESPVPFKQVRAFPSRINPSKGEKTVIRWSQAETAATTIQLFTLRGERVLTLVDQMVYTAGCTHEVVWEGINRLGSRVGCGIYIVYIQAGDYRDRIKVAVIY